MMYLYCSTCQTTSNEGGEELKMTIMHDAYLFEQELVSCHVEREEEKKYNENTMEVSGLMSCVFYPGHAPSIQYFSLPTHT